MCRASHVQTHQKDPNAKIHQQERTVLNKLQAADQPKEMDEEGNANPDEESSFTWTTITVSQTIALFCLTAVAEIGGGWFVWKCIRDRKPWYWGVIGSVTLIVYGFLPTLQPADSFGRIYAVYGGFFILLSFLAGWLLDGDKPDAGDIVGGVIALLGVLVVLFWPRNR